MLLAQTGDYLTTVPGVTTVSTYPLSTDTAVGVPVPTGVETGGLISTMFSGVGLYLTILIIVVIVLILIILLAKPKDKKEGPKPEEPKPEQPK